MCSRGLERGKREGKGKGKGGGKGGRETSPTRQCDICESVVTQTSCNVVYWPLQHMPLSLVFVALDEGLVVRTSGLE